MSDGDGIGSVEDGEPWTFSENKRDGRHKSPQSHQVPNNRRCFGTAAVRNFHLERLGPRPRTGLGHEVERNLVDQTSHWFRN